MQFVDTHTHVHFDKFAGRQDEVLKSAHEAGVTKTINVGVDLKDSALAIELAASHDNAWASAGVHPHEAKDFSDPAALTKLLKKPKVVAVGEIGLDYFKLYSDKQEQRRAFRAQIEAGLESGLPFIFHIRDAWEDFFEIFDTYQNLKGVVHSFTAHHSQLEQALARGLYVGLNGIMTFTKDEEQLEAAKQVPLDRLLLETDAPFLAPAPKRGQTCEPKDLVLTANFLAELRTEKLDDLASATTTNANKLFKLA